MQEQLKKVSKTIINTLLEEPWPIIDTDDITCYKQCKKKKLDIVFVVDGSDPATDKFKKIKKIIFESLKAIQPGMMFFRFNEILYSFFGCD